MTVKSNKNLREPVESRVVETGEEYLINFCENNLADYKCSKTFRSAEKIPRGATGKLFKRELARIYTEKNVN